MSQHQDDEGRKPPPQTPLWVKVFGLIALALVVLFIVLQVISGGEHGPQQHTPTSSAIQMLVPAA
jgi:hypothetical protein